MSEEKKRTTVTVRSDVVAEASSAIEKLTEIGIGFLPDEIRGEPTRGGISLSSVVSIGVRIMLALADGRYKLVRVDGGK